MIFASAVLLGCISFTRLPIQFVPDMQPPMMGCFVRYMRPLSVQDMERRVIIPIESVIAQLPGVQEIWAYGGSQFCFFPIRFAFGTDVRYRVVELQEHLDRFRRTFPKYSMYCEAFPFDNSWVNRQAMRVALRGPESDPFLEAINIQKVEQRLTEIQGVARVQAWGGRESIIEVAVSQDRMQEFNSPLYQILSQVRTYAAEPVFLGKVYEKGVAHYVRMLSQFQHTHELEDVIVRQEGNLNLSDVAQVQEMRVSRHYVSRVDGSPSVTLNIEKDSLTNIISLSKRVQQSLKRIEQDLPPSYSFSIIEDMSELILAAIKGLSKLAAIGLALAMVVIFLFVHDAKVTATLGILIPISIIATFNLMYFGSLTINIVSLIGLAVGVGSLVDNGIVVLENIFRHRERGVPPIEASIRGASEVTRAIFGLTVTNVVVFLPVVFIEDWIRIIFREGAFAVIFPMLISAMVALLLVPMITSRVLSVSSRRSWYSRLKGSIFSWSPLAAIQAGLRRVPRPNMPATRRFYGRLLKACLRHRVRLAIAIALVLLYTYVYSMARIGVGSMEDPQDADELSVYVLTPRGTKQSFTTNVCAKVEDLIAQHVPEKKHIRSWVSDDDAQISIELVDRSDRDRDVPEIKEALRQHFAQIPEAEVTFEWWRRRQSESNPSPVLRIEGGTIEIQGPEQAQLERLVEEITPIIEQVPGVRDLRTDLERGPTEMHFKLDRDTAALLQVTPQSIAWHLSAAQRRGDFSTIRLKREEEEIDIVFQQVTEERTSTELNDYSGGLTLQEMERLPIFAPTLMTTVPLEDLGSFEQVRGPGWIQRQNQCRIIRLMYGLTPSAKFHEVEPVVRTIVENYPLPAGFTMTLGGSSREFLELMTSVKMVVWVSVLLVYMVLAAILESFSTPFVIMMSLPLAFVGIVWSLLLTDTKFDPLAGFGAIFLVGVLPNSPLILLHFVQMMRRERSFPRERAMIIAGYARLRPILMTVGTTVLGLLPMAFKTTDNSTWVPFARVVIGGLLSSTVLTLIIVPGVYFGVEDGVHLAQRIWRWVASWRWVFLFWSRQKRTKLRERLTAYRRKAPREKPLVISTKNLTRIYEPPVLERVHAFARRLVWWGPAGSPVVGLLPYERPRLGVTPDWRQSGVTARKKALDGIELHIGAGMFGLLGPNGAGKTTLLRLLAGVDRPTRGFISVLGYNYARELKRVRKEIGYLPQEFGVYSSLSAQQYLDYLALLKGLKDKRVRQAAIDRALEMVSLSDVRDVPVGNFSGGMVQRIGLAQVFLHPPKVLIVDEPTAGLDPLERIRFRNLLTSLSADRVVILSTHIVEDVAHTCPRLAVLDKGVVTFVGETRELIALAEGRVWELVTTDESVWRQVHARFRVVSQLQTAQGIRMRIASEIRPHERARNVPPTLEDAYILHMASRGQ
jgi:HAE1 family hydrophobic/amphiphilic exporter-1